MCGIAGIINFNNQTISQNEIIAMTNRMVERGPDDDGVFIDQNVGFGFRRLSIIDLEGGHQPLSNEDNSIQLIMNGEIYNYIELRKDLISRGHYFKTNSDAEVLIHLYEEMGVDSINLLNGMFAFSLYDQKKKVVWIGRDRLGIKPIFFHNTSEKLVWASDLRAVNSVAKSEFEVNNILEYISFGYVTNNRTLRKNIEKLLPAHFIWVENNKITITKYWDILEVPKRNLTIKQAEDELDFLLQDSIRLQMRSDVPVGAFSSGGIDSSAIVALASNEAQRPLNTFTINYKEKSSKDLFYAEKVAAKYGTKQQSFHISEIELFEGLDRLITHLDEPISDSAIVPTFLISEYARKEGIRVLLNGAGGDEVFGGYLRHFSPKLFSPGWVAESTKPPISKAISNVWKLFQPERGYRSNNPFTAWGSSIAGHNLAISNVLLKDKLAIPKIQKLYLDEYAGIMNFSDNYSYARMLTDTKTYLVSNVLALLDKATMAASVEGRVPLLDHRIIEFGFSIQPEINLYNNQAKGLFKKVLTDKLPHDLLAREKEGFSAPLSNWLSKNNKIIEDELINNRCKLLDDIIDGKELSKLIFGKYNLGPSSEYLFNLYFFNKWYRSNND
jgi:asparagine synthase (glutamine-hydrolysing)